MRKDDELERFESQSLMSILNIQDSDLNHHGETESHEELPFGKLGINKEVIERLNNFQ